MTYIILFQNSCDACSKVAAMVHGAGSVDARAVSYLAITIWAYEELAHGVNWFRHLLGLAYVISTGAHLAVALGR